MKKRILSILLAVITVMQVFPVFALPIIAEDDIEGLSSDDMEVGQLYRAKFSSDTFTPYTRLPFNPHEDYANKETELPAELVVVRKGSDDYDFVYISEDTGNWPEKYADYRYVSASQLVIGGGIDVEDMVIGQLYMASWDYTDGLVELSQKVSEENAKFFVNYGYFDFESGLTSTAGFPTELIVHLKYEDDYWVYATNEEWPAAYEEYRYLDPADIIIIEEYTPVDDGYIHGKVDISCDEAVGGVVTLEKGGKTHAFTKLDAEISDNARYQWQMKLPDGRWAAIMDYILPYAVLSEALLVNNMAEDGMATLRCIVTDGDKQYASDELGLTVAKPASPVKMMAAAPAIASRSIDANTPTVAAEEEEFPVTIRYVFARLNENDQHTEAAHPYTHHLYDESQVLSTIVPSPFVMGYTACVLTDNATNDTIEFDGDGDGNVEYYLP
jgi:hypothetical protein